MTPSPEGGYGDLHSHLVPGVDDGARTLEDALEGVARMVDLGVRRIVTTPHFEGSLTLDPDGFASRMERMDRAWSEVRRAVDDAHPGLDFRRGHEVMLDLPDVDLSDERLRLGGTSFVLVEWPRLQVPPETPKVVSRIRFGGLVPVVAHPERYGGVGPEMGVVAEWRRQGAYLQVSHGSLLGRYGERARRRAFRLIERGWADYLSTDFHGRPELELYLDEAREVLEELDGAEQFSILTATNPERLLDDREPLPVPPLEIERGVWHRIRELFSSGAR